MTQLSNYIKSLNFEYAISYSGLRGEKFTILESENRKEIITIEKEIEVARFMERARLNKKIEKLKNELNVYNARIITKNKEFHRSVEQIHKFEKNDKEILKILNILSSKFDEQHVWMCPPIFRDAIVFYSKENEIVGILQICFSCNWIKNEDEEDFEVDHKIFPKLMNQLIKLGHKIENKEND